MFGANKRIRHLSRLQFADDMALVADSKEKLYRLVSEFGRVCEKEEAAS